MQTQFIYDCTLRFVRLHKFTGKERDAESGLDYFGARYYSGAMGRFMSPDWAAKVEPVPYAKLTNPQSLNLYAYVQGNPEIATDPDGHLLSFNEFLHPHSPETPGATPRPDPIEVVPYAGGYLEKGAYNAMMAQQAQQQTAKEAEFLDKGTDLIKRGGKIADNIVGEAREAATWYNIEKNSLDNAMDPPSHLGTEHDFWIAMSDYAHWNAAYHGVKAGLTPTEIAQGIFKKPGTWFVKVYFQLLTPGIEQEMRRLAENARQKMIEARQAYVAELTAVYGSSR